MGKKCYLNFPYFEIEEPRRCGGYTIRRPFLWQVCCVNAFHIQAVIETLVSPVLVSHLAVSIYKKKKIKSVKLYQLTRHYKPSNKPDDDAHADYQFVAPFHTAADPDPNYHYLS